MHYLLLSLLLVSPTVASAQELHTFSNGEVADAEKINENFESNRQLLDSLVEVGENNASHIDDIVNGRYEVDCSDDPSALGNALVNNLKGQTIRWFDFSGRCQLNNLAIYESQTIYLRGQKSDGNCPSIYSSQSINGEDISILRILEGGALLLGCVAFESSLRVDSYNGGYTRVYNDVSGPSAGFILSNTSLYKSRENQFTTTFFTLRSGSVANIWRDTNVSYYISGSLDSHLQCYGCSGSVEYLTLETGSSATFSSLQDIVAPLAVDQLVLHPGSHFYYSDSFAPVDVNNVSKPQAASNNSAIKVISNP